MSENKEKKQDSSLNSSSEFIIFIVYIIIIGILMILLNSFLKRQSFSSLIIANIFLVFATSLIFSKYRLFLNHFVNISLSILAISSSYFLFSSTFVEADNPISKFLDHKHKEINVYEFASYTATQCFITYKLGLEVIDAFTSYKNRKSKSAP